MKRLLTGFALGSVLVFGPASLAGAVVNPKTTSVTLRLFSKTIAGGFTTASGVPLSMNAAPAAGDLFTTADNDYHGNHLHYGSVLAGSDALHCVVTAVTKSAVPATCFGVISIGGSMIYSVTTTNFASNASTTVYPVTGGTGVFKGATGRVVTTSVGNTGNTDFTIEITTP